MLTVRRAYRRTASQRAIHTTVHPSEGAYDVSRYVPVHCSHSSISPHFTCNQRPNQHLSVLVARRGDQTTENARPTALWVEERLTLEDYAAVQVWGSPDVERAPRKLGSGARNE